MKKLHFFLIIAFCLVDFQAKGQSSAGVKADLNFSKFWVTQSTNLKCSMKAGYAAGFFYNYLWRETAGIQADMLFRFRSSTIESKEGGEKADFSYFGIELPVYFMQKIEIDDYFALLGIGPYASYGLQSRLKSPHQNIDPYKIDPLSEKSKMHRWDFGVGFIIGYELKSGLQFNFNYLMGFRNLVNDGFEGSNMIANSLGFGVGYRF